MVTYPSSANINSTVFSVISETTYSSTANLTTFSLSTYVNHLGQVFVLKDGVAANKNEFYLTNDNTKISFYAPPSSASLTIKVLDVPDKFLLARNIDTIVNGVVHYNNVASTVAGNTYIIDGSSQRYALPEGVVASSKAEILVYIDGVYQQSDLYTLPDSQLGYQGITFSSPVPANTTMDIHTITNTRQTVLDRAYTMEDRKPDNGFSEDAQVDIITFSTQANYERRRQRSRRIPRSFSLTYTNLLAPYKRAIEQFYYARGGNFEAFTFDLSHIGQTGSAIVRFDGPLNIQHVRSSPVNDLNSIWTVQIKLAEVYT